MVSTSGTPTPATHSTSSFYLLRNDFPATPSEVSGSTNLLVQNGLEQVYHKFCSKKVKENLSAFLPLVSGKSVSRDCSVVKTTELLLQKTKLCVKPLAVLFGQFLCKVDTV
ncbi:hypothetical protein QZH41_008572 [Actinostola sp. cb2023]|nr:hypothetical protein QZH41_008572 [Actinostola sp. cb2023]